MSALRQSEIPAFVAARNSLIISVVICIAISLLLGVLLGRAGFGGFGSGFLSLTIGGSIHLGKSRFAEQGVVFQFFLCLHHFRLASRSFGTSLGRVGRFLFHIFFFAHCLAFKHSVRYFGNQQFDGA